MTEESPVVVLLLKLNLLLCDVCESVQSFLSCFQKTSMAQFSVRGLTDIITKDKLRDCCGAPKTISSFISFHQDGATELRSPSPLSSLSV